MSMNATGLEEAIRKAMLSEVGDRIDAVRQELVNEFTHRYRDELIKVCANFTVNAERFFNLEESVTDFRISLGVRK